MFFIIQFIIFLFFFCPSKKVCSWSNTKTINLCLTRAASTVWLGNNKVKSICPELFFFPLLCTLRYFKCLSHGVICQADHWITVQLCPHFVHNVLQPELWNRLTHWDLLDLCSPTSLGNLSHWSEHSAYTGMQHSDDYLHMYSYKNLS